MAAGQVGSTGHSKDCQHARWPGLRWRGKAPSTTHPGSMKTGRCDTPVRMGYVSVTRRREGALLMLEKALMGHLLAAESHPLGLQRFAHLETSWVLTAIQALLSSAPEPTPPGHPPSHVLATCSRSVVLTEAAASGTGVHQPAGDVCV